MNYLRALCLGALLSLLGGLFLLHATHAFGAAPSALKIPDGTPLRLSLMDTLNSGTNEVDDPIHFDVTEDVKIGDAVAIPKGSTATGHVVEVEPKRRMGRAGKLNFSVDFVKAPDGTNVRLRATSIRKGEDKSGTVIVGTVLLSPLFLIMHGKDINIPKGTQFGAYVDGDREIALGGAAQPALAAPAQTAGAPSSVATQTAPAPAPASAELSTVVVKSVPDGSDITVDGKYIGNTPSTVRLPAGDHTVMVEKSGFKTWQRTMTVSPGGIVTVSATLEANPPS
jgi:hypothetical protein